jgi:hypothetical protein
MSDNLTILDDILNCGFTAPRLADMANANHLSIVAIADQVQTILKQKTHFAVVSSTGTLKQKTHFAVVSSTGTDTETRNDSSRNVILRSTSFLDNVCRPLRTIKIRVNSGCRKGELFIRNSNMTEKARGYLNFACSTFSGLLEFPEHCQMTMLHLNSDFDLPFVVAIDEPPHWEDKLEKTRMAPEIREQLFDAIKENLGSQTRGTYSSDVLGSSSRRRDNKANIAEFASLFSGKKITKSMERDEVMTQLEAAPMSDMGITNIDDLACVIYLAGKAFDLEMYWERRANLCNMEGYLAMRVSDCQQKLGGAYKKYDKREALCQFIEFCGGKVPSTICWRREKVS